MRNSTPTDVGLLSTLPLLFSLMGVAAFFLVGILVFGLAIRQEGADAAIAHEQQAHEVAALDEEAAQVHTRLTALQQEIDALRAARDGQTSLAALRAEVQRSQAALESAQQAYAQLQHQKATLVDQLAALHQLEQRVADMRRSRADIERQAKELADEIAALTQQIAGVQREVEAREQVQAKNLVPAGSRKPAVFVECDAAGVWMMPERTSLPPSVPPADRDAFLARAKAKGYVVFLIRPNGFTAFKRYREVLETYNQTAQVKLDIGFEPVNADWKLVYPNE